MASMVLAAIKTYPDFITIDDEGAVSIKPSGQLDPITSTGQLLPPRLSRSAGSIASTRPSGTISTGTVTATAKPVE